MKLLAGMTSVPSRNERSTEIKPIPGMIATNETDVTEFADHVNLHVGELANKCN